MSETQPTEKIQVLEEKVSDLDVYISRISDSMSAISDDASAITSILAHGKWRGDSRDACLEVYNTLFGYYHAVDDCYRDMVSAIAKLVEDVDGFKGNSAEIAKLF